MNPSAVLRYAREILAPKYQNAKSLYYAVGLFGSLVAFYRPFGAEPGAVAIPKSKSRIYAELDPKPNRTFYFETLKVFEAVGLAEYQAIGCLRLILPPEFCAEAGSSARTPVNPLWVEMQELFCKDDRECLDRYGIERMFDFLREFKGYDERKVEYMISQIDAKPRREQVCEEVPAPEPRVPKVIDWEMEILQRDAGWASAFDWHPNAEELSQQWEKSRSANGRDDGHERTDVGGVDAAGTATETRAESVDGGGR